MDAISCTVTNAPWPSRLASRWCATSITKRVLLHPTSFRVPYGTVTALVGSRGAGRSTLLKMIAAESRPTTGNIKFSCDTTDGSLVLVREREPMLESLTPYESVYFASRCSSSGDSERNTVEKLTHEILEALDLVQVAHSPISELSATDRLCTTLGVALASSPRVLLLDGITSQFDRLDSVSVLLLLRSLASKGCTVILSINHPSMYPLAFLDNVVMLAQGRQPQPPHS